MKQNHVAQGYSQKWNETNKWNETIKWNKVKTTTKKKKLLWKYKHSKYSGKPQRCQPQEKDSVNDFCFMYI